MLVPLRRVPWSPTFGLQRIDGPPCLHPRCVPFRPLLVLALVAPQSAQPRNVLRRFRQVSRAQVELRESVLELSAESAELVEQVIAGLNEACTSVKGTISGLQRQIRDPSEAELWISRGNALLQVTQQWYPGMTEVEAPDYSRLGDDGLPLSMTVELNPKKHFKENAKLCFKQASKITKAIEKCTPLLKAQEEELQRWKAELTKVEGSCLCWCSSRAVTYELCIENLLSLLLSHGRDAMRCAQNLQSFRNEFRISKKRLRGFSLLTPT
ncbi:unnamed protein product [Cladocopium goreaui]|uniref:Uncharacterized protein n=1 Tax=Cladocopium goreaui TaxID=2562237 RepID=A0A9P1BKV9_9DINO|nr:unnamed protein product [Cladocopium goreaui]